MGDRSEYRPAELKLPLNLADTPKTREDFAAYLAEITYMDSQVGEILRELQSAGRTEDSLVMFTSEQGSQFPGNKWTCWDTGLHTALIVRWPGKVQPHTRTDAIIQYADIAPTLVEVAKGAVTDHSFDGRSFAAVLQDASKPHREFAYAVHNNIPEGPAYPIRSVTDGRWRYIRNLTPQEIFIEKHLMGLLGGATVHNAYWSSWMATSSDNPATYQLVKRYLHRPAEELYFTAEDPAEMNNLVDHPEHSVIRSKLSRELDLWLNEQQDPGIPQDTVKAHESAKRGRHLFPASP
jgi:uncharacterized sulfatase